MQRSVLVAGSALLCLAACAGRGEVNLVEYRVPDEKSRLVVTVDACNADPRLLKAEETSAEVRLFVEADLSALGRSSCADSLTVDLSEPLGDRQVVDGHNGSIVSRRLP